MLCAGMQSAAHLSGSRVPAATEVRGVPPAPSWRGSERPTAWFLLTMVSVRVHPAAVAALTLLLLPQRAWGVDVTDLLAHVRRALEPGHDMRARVEFVMTNPDGERVYWEGEFYRVGGPNPRKRFVLESPVDLRGVSVSVERLGPGTDRTRLYVPFLRRPREIEGDQRGEPFFGTDFNFEDLGLERLDFEEDAIRGEETVAGRPCYRVESTPSKIWWYGRIARDVDEKDWLPRRTEYYDPSGALYKVRTFDRIETIAGFLTPVEITMTAVPLHTSTRLVLRNVEYDTGLRDELVEER